MLFTSDLTDVFFYGALVALLIMGFGYFLYYIKAKRPLFRHLSIRVQINNIVTIALFSAIATVILIFFTKINNITLIPAIRVSFEGVLVKIAGFTFGPIVGLISAFATELAVVVFVPTYFHYKYLIVLMAFGFFAGLVRVFRQNSTNDRWAIFALYTGIISFALLTLLFFFLRLDYTGTDRFAEQMQRFYTNYFETFNFQTLLFWADILLFGALLVAISFLFFVERRTNAAFRFMIKYRSLLISILCLTIFAEYLISVFIATSANRTVFGEAQSSAQLLMMSALFLAPFKIIINTVIIFTVHRILVAFRPSLKI